MLKFRKRKKNRCLVFTSSRKREIRQFHVVVMAKKRTKNRDARAKLFFRQSKPIAFLPFSLPSPSSLLKLPDIIVLELPWTQRIARNAF